MKLLFYSEIFRCSQIPCQHNSTCIELVDDFICICAGGWTDSTCSTNINECFSSPCENQGICQDEINGYNCVCQPGFTGTRCETSKYLTKCASKTMLCLWKMWTFSTMISVWFQLFLWVNAKVCQSLWRPVNVLYTNFDLFLC